MSHGNTDQIIFTAAVKAFVNDIVIRAIAHVYVEDVILRETLKRMVVNAVECREDMVNRHEQSEKHQHTTDTAEVTLCEAQADSEEHRKSPTKIKSKVSFKTDITSTPAVLVHEEIQWNGSSRENDIEDLSCDSKTKSSTNKEKANETPKMKFKVTEDSNNDRHHLNLRRSFSTGINFVVSLFTRCKRHGHGSYRTSDRQSSAF